MAEVRLTASLEPSGWDRSPPINPRAPAHFHRVGSKSPVALFSSITVSVPIPVPVLNTAMSPPIPVDKIQVDVCCFLSSSSILPL